MISKESVYWLGYSVDEFSTKEDLKPRYNLEEAIKEAISYEYWGNLDGMEVKVAYKDILAIAEPFYNEVGYITINILQAMICQH